MSRITRQSGITYLKTEVDISRDLMVPVHGPIRVFDLAALGIDPERFIRDLGPSFDELSWDRYTVAEKRVRMLIELFPEEAERLTAFLPVYYDKGDDALRQIVDLLRRMPQRDRTAFDHIRSYRRRSIAEFVLTNRFTASWEDQWHVEQTLVGAFEQDVGDEDARKLKRHFDPTATHVIDHPDFERLLLAVAEMVEDAEEDRDLEPAELNVTFHQMGQVARSSQPPLSMANEGLHKDGADYIVSALVIRRQRVIGGESIIRLGDKRTKALSITLRPGQGLFQADDKSAFWHEVTPVELHEVDEGEEGIRDIFGFDVEVISRRPRTTT